MPTEPLDCVIVGAGPAGLTAATYLARFRRHVAVLGAEVEGNGELLVNVHLETSVDSLNAAGDVVSALNQIAVATGHGAIAASAIHGRLPLNLM